MYCSSCACSCSFHLRKIFHSPPIRRKIRTLLNHLICGPLRSDSFPKTYSVFLLELTSPRDTADIFTLVLVFISLVSTTTGSGDRKARQVSRFSDSEPSCRPSLERELLPSCALHASKVMQLAKAARLAVVPDRQEKKISVFSRTDI